MPGIAGGESNVGVDSSMGASGKRPNVVAVLVRRGVVRLEDEGVGSALDPSDSLTISTVLNQQRDQNWPQSNLTTHTTRTCVSLLLATHQVKRQPFSVAEISHYAIVLDQLSLATRVSDDPVMAE